MKGELPFPLCLTRKVQSYPPVPASSVRASVQTRGVFLQHAAPGSEGIEEVE